jgi:putative endonuclease
VAAKKRPSSGAAPRRTSKQVTGDAGEQRAADLFAALGFAIVARNHRTPRGEVDLVAEKGPLVVFVEVRARASDRFGTAEATVDARKQARVVAAARDWLAKNGGEEREIRFDVVAVVGDEVRHVPGAFDAGGW